MFQETHGTVQTAESVRVLERALRWRVYVTTLLHPRPGYLVNLRTSYIGLLINHTRHPLSSLVKCMNVCALCVLDSDDAWTA